MKSHLRYLFRELHRALLRMIFFSVQIALVTSALAVTYRAFDLYTIDEIDNGSVVIAHAYKEVFYQIAAGGDVIDAGFANTDRAVLWSGPGGNPIELHPASGFNNSEAYATDGIQQVGYGGTSNAPHALLWNGAASSVVDLHPAHLNFFNTAAFGVGGGQQVGYGFSAAPFMIHALLWNGTSNSAVDLNPTNLGISSSFAYGTDGQYQVGRGGEHALLWRGTASSAVDLHPSGFDRSTAVAVSGGQQVGFACRDLCQYPSEPNHAIVWNGTASSAIDLNPVGFYDSRALGTNGAWQVGWGRDANYLIHALAWNGTAESVVNLHELLDLPLGSLAYSIDSEGTIYGVAFDGNARVHAVAWKLVPEPVGIVLITAGAFGLTLLRRRSAQRPIDPSMLFLCSRVQSARRLKRPTELR